LSVPVLNNTFSLLAFLLVQRIILALAEIGGVMVFSGPRGCVSMIELSVDAKVGVISACSDESSPLQFTIMGLSSSNLHVISAHLRAFRKKSGVVRPVSPMYGFAPKMSAALLRTCHEKDLCLGLLSRHSCRRSFDCRSSSKDVTLLKTLTSR